MVRNSSAASFFRRIRSVARTVVWRFRPPAEALEVVRAAAILGDMAYMTSANLLEARAFVAEMLAGQGALRLGADAERWRQDLTVEASRRAVDRFRYFVREFGPPAAESRRRLLEAYRRGSFRKPERGGNTPR
jgi:hypothetical protein